MSRNSEQMAEELVKLDCRPEPFTAPKARGGAESVQFEYPIRDESRSGETVTLGLAEHANEEEWPEVAPRWLYLLLPDEVLAEQVKGFRSRGVVNHYGGEDGRKWTAMSAVPRDFWDQIATPDGKRMKTYLDRCVRRIWRVR